MLGLKETIEGTIHLSILQGPKRLYKGRNLDLMGQEVLWKITLPYKTLVLDPRSLRTTMTVLVTKIDFSSDQKFFGSGFLRVK